MKLVELPDDIADILLQIEPEKRGEYLKAHGFSLPPDKGGFEGGFIQKTLLQLFTDGASRGNPGEAGIGFVIKDSSGKVLHEGRKYIGITTNNVSEWTGLLTGLLKVQEFGAKNISCFLDSELVVKQMKGEYKVKHPDLQPFHAKAKEICKKFDTISFTHIPREQNAHADQLSNEAIDQGKL